MTEYLRFLETKPDDRKTKIVFVHSTQSGALLGEIRWFGRWRQYAFYPHALTIWNPDCLDAVSERIRILNVEHAREVRQRRTEKRVGA